MTSVYAVSVLLLVCLYAQAPAQGTTLRLLRVSRTSEGSHWKLDVVYEGNVPDSHVFWYNYREDKPRLEFNNTNGVLSTRVRKYESRFSSVKLYFYQDKSNILGISFNTGGNDDRSWNLDFPVSEISPSADVTVEPGVPATVTVTVNEARGNSQMKNYNPVSFSGEWVDLDTNETENADKAPFQEESVSTEGSLTINKITFNLDKKIKGYFRVTIGSIEATINNSGPIDMVLETIILSVNAGGDMHGLEYPFYAIAW